MKLVDEFRDPQRLRDLLQQVREQCRRRWTIMDVCGGQTHHLLKYGIEAELSDVLTFLHGPGCPVCVTPAEVIDAAVQLALQPGVMLTSFGDMLRVPGRTRSLLQARAAGGQVRTVYSPCDAVQWASRHPECEVVFFAVGFETTAPSTALAVLQAEARGVRNFSVLAHHVCVEPAMRMIAADPARRVSGFLAAGHVCTVTGYQTLSTLAAEFHLPVVVTGFEPVDLLEGILGCVTQLEAGRAEVENRYTRCVQPQGNPAAQRLVERVFDVVDLPWRGLGTITQGGFALRSDYASYDARQRFPQFTNISAAPVATSPAPSTTSSTETNHDAETYCASVLTGTWKPTQCPLFGKTCTPESPRGAPMVSSEGACAAYFRYPPVSEPTDV